MVNFREKIKRCTNFCAKITRRIADNKKGIDNQNFTSGKFYNKYRGKWATDNDSEFHLAAGAAS